MVSCNISQCPHQTNYPQVCFLLSSGVHPLLSLSEYWTTFERRCSEQSGNFYYEATNQTLWKCSITTTIKTPTWILQLWEVISSFPYLGWISWGSKRLMTCSTWCIQVLCLYTGCTINLDGQFNRNPSHLGDTLLGMSVTVFPEELKWGGKTLSPGNMGGILPWAGVP